MQRIFSLRRSCSKVKPSLLRLGEYKYGENYDPKRAEPDTESPYFGNPNNVNKSGVWKKKYICN